MKVRLILACTAALALLANAATASITFDGTPGTSAPPGSLGGYTMTSFGDDPRSDFGTVSDAPGPNGDVAFDVSVSHFSVGNGWATWSHGYTGDVYYTSGTSLEMTMPTGTLAFYFYAEPNPFDWFEITAVAADGSTTSSGPISVTGSSGAKYFGFYATGGDVITSITVSSTVDFAVGEFGIYQCELPTISVALSPNALWPPNHNYRDIAATVTTNGSCGTRTVELVSVASNEPDNGDDDGNTVDDVTGVTTGTADYAFRVRAERSGMGTGRIYTATYKVTDSYGNEAYGTATVTVPLSQGHKPVLTMDEWNGTVLDQNRPNPVLSVTEIPFHIGQAGAVDVVIHDVTGAVVRTMHLGELSAGTHSAKWDGLNDDGIRVAAGHYVYTLVGVECGCSTAKTMNVVR